MGNACCRLSGRTRGSWPFRKFNPVLPVLALVVCLLAATSVFSVTAEAAYPTSFAGTVTTDSTSASNWMISESESSALQTLEVISYGSAVFTISWDAGTFLDGQIMQGQLRGYINATAPTVSGWTNKAIYVDIKNTVIDTTLRQTAVEPAVLTGGRGYFRQYITEINDRAGIGVMVSYEIHGTYSRDGSTSNVQQFLAVGPSVTTQSMQFSGTFMPLTALLPDLHDIRNAMLDPTTGWLPTMNTNLQTMVTSQATTNTLLTTSNTLATTGNTYLDSINSRVNTTNIRLTTTNNNLQAIYDQLVDSEVRASADAEEIILNQYDQIDQLQVIVDYVNSTQAAQVIDDANDDFVQQAGDMESGQAVLEDAADDAIDNVDTTANLNIITIYRTSINFWMRCVNALPTVTGAFWDALIFGVFLAFIMFILRLSR